MTRAPQPLEDIYRCHDGTKHHFHAFARSLGYLDWASQPAPFRAYAGAESFALYPAPPAVPAGYTPRVALFDELFGEPSAAEPVTAAAIGDLLRHALGLSAWKVSGPSRWALRVNPSSGNLHPTEAYVICGATAGLAGTPAVYHYAPDRHALEIRCRFDADAWTAAWGASREIVLVALTSIHWREAWKYGERAFRYCQHDLGHAVAAIDLAAALFGWTTRLLGDVAHEALAGLAGVDRDEDFVEAEREEPGCLLALGPAGTLPHECGDRVDALAAAVRRGTWTGRASQLSEDHVEWTFIDEIARVTHAPSRFPPSRPWRSGETGPPSSPHSFAGPTGETAPSARAILLQRRSALAFDGRSSLPRASFEAMMSRLTGRQRTPCDALPWTPRIHALLFVHRVDGVEPGLYVLLRDPEVTGRFRAACGRAFSWEPVVGIAGLSCLARGDCRQLAKRLSCDQDIAADGFFSVGMLADFDASLAEYGPSFYRHLFWESGVVGQLLYLEAEAAGARATGIGCFYDDPVHDVLGLKGHAFQSLYHFTVGMPVEDRRLTTEPGYAWEAKP